MGFLQGLGINTQGTMAQAANNTSGTQAAGGMFNNPNPIDNSLGLPNPMNQIMNSTMNQFQASPASLQAPTTAQQANQAYNQTQGGLSQQQAFANAVAGQNGLGNQSNVFNRYADLASGQGPNPAMAQLAQTTGQNIASQNALVAGQRGASSNAGLLARQAAMQGANTQQQAVGQAATLGANQQLSALGQMGNIANQQVANQAGAIQGYNQAAQNQQGNILNSLNSQNNANVAMQSNINNVNAGVAEQNAKTNANLVGGMMNGAGSLLSMLADGGEVKPQQQPQQPSTPPQSPISQSSADVFKKGFQSLNAYAEGGPVSYAGQFLSGITDKVADPGAPQVEQTKPMESSDSNPFAMKSPGGGGGGGLSSMLAKGGQINGEKYAKQMKPVPGKASVKGDSLKNDKVKALLSPGEVIIPRSVMQSDDPASNAAKFVAAVLSKKGRRK